MQTGLISLVLNKSSVLFLGLNITRWQ